MNCVNCNKKIKSTESNLVYSFKYCKKCNLEYCIANCNNSIVFITGMNKLFSVDCNCKIQISEKLYNDKSLNDYIKSFEETIPLDLDKGSRIQNMYNRFIEFSRFVNNDLFL